MGIAAERGYKPGWAAYKFKEKFGMWPPIRNAKPMQPSQEVRAWVRSRDIAWAKAQEKNEGGGMSNTINSKALTDTPLRKSPRQSSKLAALISSVPAPIRLAFQACLDAAGHLTGTLPIWPTPIRRSGCVNFP